MKIRGRLLILLLTIALAPLILSTAFHQISVRRIGSHLAAETREQLLARAHALLHSLVDDFGRILERDEALVLVGLNLQAREIEHRLAAPPPPVSQLYFAEDFDRGENLPAGMIPSERHLRPGPGGEPVPIPVNYQHQVIFLPRGVARAAVADDLARLSSMPEVYRLILGFRPDLILWQFTALESGVHTSFPAKGGYPPEYDPRKRAWYQGAREAGAKTRQFVTDLTTRELMLTLSMPVHRPDGSFAGVTAIDLVYDRLFADWEMPVQWAEVAERLILSYREMEGAGGDKLETVLQSGQAGLGRSWQAPVEKQFVATDDPQEMAAVLEDVRAGNSGVRKVHYEGREVLWAYGAQQNGSPFPLVIVPYERIVAPATRAEAYALEQVFAGLMVVGLILGGVLVVVTALAISLSRTVTLPVRQLAAAAQRLAQGDFAARVEIRTHDELQELGEVFNAMGPSLREREEMKQSLALAREIQQHLLPQEQPRLKGFDIAGSSLYCDETGGDYYDFIELVELGPEKLGLAVGDVTGHGIGAALVMTTLRGVLRSQAGRHGTDLVKLFHDLNLHLVRDTSDEFFMTLFYGVLDGAARTFHWISGGHGPVFWFRGGARVEELPCSGIPLGIIEGTPFDSAAPKVLAPGDILLIGTDGIWETSNPAGEMYGTERLCRVMANCSERPAGEIHATIMKDLGAFRGEAPQDDDITMVIIKALSMSARQG